MLELFTKFSQEALALSFLEITGVISALVYVYLATKSNRWCFLFGLISSIIYVYITYKFNYFFDFGINIYYIIMSFYGWVSWSKAELKTESPIKKIDRTLLFIYLIAGTIITLVLASLATRFSSASLPYLDAFTTIFSVIATFMVVKKQLENWLFWIIIDLVAMGMYYYKGLYFTSLLFLIYTVVAIFGYYKWKKQYQNQ